ncbi:glycine betaine ABC transporter substrate-binding protein [Devosia rhodophyticola]|uniref:Glycine betaine ABC transporter substrate-binding protein n=1 Tax=Devosia rhodophyticola TaxID=3026423 RepID=A0ABY7YTS5_9HYPH|nr:glycine betaine ABC transporter substrate-binding protein [Devosia rhodophyticola]WDR04597.1 glycine betaine ABC transporter substrate-binding protein [Devosia rhodophyticola]
MLGTLRYGLVVLAVLLAIPASFAQAEFTVLDQAQDASGSATNAPAPDDPAAPPPICGTKPINIARMGWSSAALMAEIHARVLTRAFDCKVQVVPGDLATTGSSMGSTGQPAVAPEMWVTRISDVWNGAIKAQMVRPAATTYSDQVFEGWYAPSYLVAAYPDIVDAAKLSAILPEIAGGQKITLISCPTDWGCRIINQNLVRALGIEDLVDIVTPANRFAMDSLIAEAVSKRDPVLLYYWQPNAVLAQFNFSPVNLGPYNEEAFKCLAQSSCADPVPSSFAPESVMIALSEWVFTDAPGIAAYFTRAILPTSEMSVLLMALNAPGASVESVADQFVAERGDIWSGWVGSTGQ